MGKVSFSSEYLLANLNGKIFLAVCTGPQYITLSLISVIRIYKCVPTIARFPQNPQTLTIT